MRLWPRSRAQTGFFICGKHPSSGDFLRHSTSALDLDWMLDWLSDIQLAGMQGRPGESTGALRYCVRSAKPSRFVAGLIASSSDSAGRQFPITVGGYFDIAGEGGELTPLSLFLEPFYLAGEALLDRIVTDPKPAVQAELYDLSRARLGTLSDARRTFQGWAEQASGDTFLRDALKSPAPSDLAFALHVLRRARGDEQRKANDEEGARHLATPRVDQTGRVGWLYLFERLFKLNERDWALAYIAKNQMPLILALGRPTASLARFALGEGNDAVDRWPVFTDRMPALDAAERVYGSAVRERLPGHLPLTTWVEEAEKLTHLEL